MQNIVPSGWTAPHRLKAVSLGAWLRIKKAAEKYLQLTYTTEQKFEVATALNTHRGFEEVGQSQSG